MEDYGPGHRIFLSDGVTPHIYFRNVLDVNMAVKNVATMALVFALAFFCIIFYMIYTFVSSVMDDNSGMGWFIFAFLGIFFLIIAAPIVAIIFSMRKKRTSAVYSTDQTVDPMMYDNRGAAPGYCRFCGANIGSSDPKYCPECGKSLRH